MKEQEVKRDIFGYPIGIGDLVTYLPPGEGKGALHFGKVIGFTSKQVRLETSEVTSRVKMVDGERVYSNVLSNDTIVRPLHQMVIANNNERLKGFSLPFLANIIKTQQILVLFSEEYDGYPAEWLETIIKADNPEFVGL